MERLKGFRKIASILFVPIVIIGLMVYTFIKMNRINDSLSKEYLLIEKKDAINDVITDIYFPDGFRDTPSTKLVKFSNGNKRTLFTYKHGDSISISEVINVGTKITKKKDSDTIYLSNITNTDTMTYYFRIRNGDFE